MERLPYLKKNILLEIGIFIVNLNSLKFQCNSIQRIIHQYNLVLNITLIRLGVFLARYFSVVRY